ncbi:hypothetical protein BDZ97DRAFT_924078 [Flammula alnicola]|nr:hypothetical protein BDZ97DRAFT_924078 [Flammula alnicola]
MLRRGLLWGLFRSRLRCMIEAFGFPEFSPSTAQRPIKPASKDQEDVSVHFPSPTLTKHPLKKEMTHPTALNYLQPICFGYIHAVFKNKIIEESEKKDDKYRGTQTITSTAGVDDIGSSTKFAKNASKNGWSAPTPTRRSLGG